MTGNKKNHNLLDPTTVPDQTLDSNTSSKKKTKYKTQKPKSIVATRKDNHNKERRKRDRNVTLITDIYTSYAKKIDNSVDRVALESEFELLKKALGNV